MTIIQAVQNQSIFRRALGVQIRASRWLDCFLPEVYRRDGNKDFLERILPSYIEKSGQTVYDFGGGSQPCISVAQKQLLNHRFFGLDIDAEELNAAPAGAYDGAIVADLTAFVGNGDADLVVCQATLEHVPDNAAAFRAIASTLKVGGKALLFMPSKYAVFAQLNLLLPENVKKKLLFTLFPHKAEGHDGFKAFYNRCTPREFRQLARCNGLEVIELQPYYISSYFQICFPIYALWRVWVILFKWIAGENAAETFSLVLEKKQSVKKK